MINGSATRRVAAVAALGCALFWQTSALLAQDLVAVGAGSYLRGLPAGAAGPPTKPFVTPAIAARPIPTNDWWSSLAWMPFSEAMYPHPLAVRASETGLHVYYPGPNITANKAGIFGAMPAGKGDFVIGHGSAETFRDARVDGFSDWFVSALFARNDAILRTTFGHGSPFVFVTFAAGNPVIAFEKNRPRIWSRLRDDAVLGFSIENRSYAVFAPTGRAWSGLEGNRWTFDAKDRNYCAVAALPDARIETLTRFADLAHNHVVDSKVTWASDARRSVVTTHFALGTRAMEHSPDETSTLTALYPHQWKQTNAAFTGETFASVRGAMKLARGTGFDTTTPFHGVLPSLPWPEAADTSQLAAFLRAEAKESERRVADTYWLGKQLGKWSTFAALADAAGESAIAATSVTRIRGALENFFTATSPEGTTPKTKDAGLFAYDPTWGALIGYPASYGSDTQLNDHHFHYGYFVRAAAELTFRDPAWAKQWNAMVRLLIRDMATIDRNDPLFPFLRCFDPYAGHSWASGHARFGDGNNNESSSEAVNAWAAVILYAEAVGDRVLRDAGIWLFSTEIEAINDYWFDVTGALHHPDYPASVVTMVWGGKGANATWFSAEPELIHGINWLPFTAASLYLGAYPEYSARNYAALVAERAEKNAAPSREARNESASTPQWRQWADIIWMYRALSDASDARRQFAGRPSDFKPEQGNSLANVEAWITALETFGTVDRSVSADTPFYATFKKGAQRTYIVYNFGPTERIVHFSDGQDLTCKPHAFTTRSL